MRWIATAAAILLATPTALSAGKSLPYTAYVQAPQAEVRSGPGQEYYPATRLSRGAAVEVYRHDPNGWLAIKPPEDSHSFVAAQAVSEPDEEGLVEVIADDAVAWIGSFPQAGAHSPTTQLLWQVRLRPGEILQTLALERKINAPVEQTHAWWKVSPPAGEFRWIHRDDVLLKPPTESPAPATQPQIVTLTPAEAMDAIEAELLRMTAQEPQEWRLAILRKNTQTLAEKASSESVRQRARVSLTEIARLAALQERALAEQQALEAASP